MKRVIVLGAGAHAAELEGYILDHNLHSEDKYEIIGYYDDNKENWIKYNFKFPFLGGMKDFNSAKDENIEILLGIANVKFRKVLIDYYLNIGAKFSNFVHYSSFVFDTSQIGVGNVICRNCVLGPNVRLGDFNSLNTNVSLGHDSVIGNNNVICPNVGFSGNSSVGHNNFFSLNSTTVPNIVIGDDNTIAPNMTIEVHVKNNTTVFYRFKERVLFQPK